MALFAFSQRELRQLRQRHIASGGHLSFEERELLEPPLRHRGPGAGQRPGRDDPAKTRKERCARKGAGKRPAPFISVERSNCCQADISREPRAVGRQEGLQPLQGDDGCTQLGFCRIRSAWHNTSRSTHSLELARP